MLGISFPVVSVHWEARTHLRREPKTDQEKGNWQWREKKEINLYIKKKAFTGKESKQNNLKLRDTAKEDIKFLIRCSGKGESKSAPLGERRSTLDYGENWNGNAN